MPAGAPCKKGLSHKHEAAPKIFNARLCTRTVQEPGVGVLLSRDTKQNASRIYRIRDGISSVLATKYRKNNPVRRTGKITQRCLGGVGLQKADSDLLPFGENRVLTPSAI